MNIEKVGIHTEYIQLDQFLKYINIIGSGGQVRFLIEDQAILINGTVCTEKRKKLYVGDRVEVLDAGIFEVVAEEV